MRHFVIAIGIALVVGQAAWGQSKIIPQVADGGGWQTAIVVSNISSAALTATLRFHQDTGGGATQDWFNPLGGASVIITLAAGGTQFVRTPGIAATATVGWAEVSAPIGVEAYAIFTQRVPGRQDQDGTADATSTTSRVLVPYDNSGGFVTSIAVVNPNGFAESVQVMFNSDVGGTLGGAPLNLPALGHTGFALPDLFPATTGKRGMAELYSATGDFSIVAFRFNPTGAFTTAPFYKTLGAPILAPGGGNGSGPTIISLNITNKLIYPIDLSVNGQVVTQVAGSSSTTLSNVTATTNMRLSWTLVRPTLAGTGAPVGDPMSGAFATIANPSGTYNLLVNNVIGTQQYFAPIITNTTTQAFLLGVNMELQSENRCNCTMITNQTYNFGYYKLFTNSNVRAYLAGANYTGQYHYWGYDSSNPTSQITGVEADTGVVRLNLSQPLGGGGGGGSGSGSNGTYVSPIPSQCISVFTANSFGLPDVWFQNNCTVAVYLVYFWADGSGSGGVGAVNLAVGKKDDTGYGVDYVNSHSGFQLYVCPAGYLPVDSNDKYVTRINTTFRCKLQ